MKKNKLVALLVKWGAREGFVKLPMDYRDQLFAEGLLPSYFASVVSLMKSDRKLETRGGKADREFHLLV